MKFQRPNSDAKMLFTRARQKTAHCSQLYNVYCVLISYCSMLVLNFSLSLNCDYLKHTAWPCSFMETLTIRQQIRYLFYEPNKSLANRLAHRSSAKKEAFGKRSTLIRKIGIRSAAKTQSPNRDHTLLQLWCWHTNRMHQMSHWLLKHVSFQTDHLLLRFLWCNPIHSRSMQSITKILIAPRHSSSAQFN